MSSKSLVHWGNIRSTALDQIDAQCTACLATEPPNQILIDENLRAYVLLLSAHFQGFCRDIYTESSQFVASNVRPNLQILLQNFFTVPLPSLDRGNPNLQNIKLDFRRFGFEPDLEGSDSANKRRISHLADLNQWRNAAAHHGNPPDRPLTIQLIRTWRDSCKGLATSLDRIMYNQLRNLVGNCRPWIP